MKRLNKTILALVIGALFMTGVSALNDLPQGEWYTDAVAFAVENGYISYEGDAFIAEEPITLGDALRAFSKATGVALPDPESNAVSEGPISRADAAYSVFCLLNNPTVNVPVINRFAKASDLSPVSVDEEILTAVNALYETGVMTGKDASGAFCPTDTLTKEEAAVIVCRLLDPAKRVKLPEIKGISFLEALAAYPGDLTEADQSAAYVSDTGFAVSSSLVDLIVGASNARSLDAELNTLTAGEAFMKEQGFVCDPAVFEQMLADYENEPTLQNYPFYVLYVFNTFMNKAYQEYMQTHRPAFEDLKTLIDSQFRRVKHILIQFPDDSEESKAAVYKQITQIASRLENGEDFDQLIEDYGEDPGMQANPDGYVFTFGQMVKPFEDAAFSMEENTVSDIVETVYGCHILLRLPITEEQYVSIASAIADQVSGQFFEEAFAAVDERVSFAPAS